MDISLQSIFYLVGCGMFCWIGWMYTSILNLLRKENQRQRDVYVSLDEDDFNCLVRGGVLKIAYVDKRQVVQVCLKDIGFDRMDKAIDSAKRGNNIRQDHHKVIV